MSAHNKHLKTPAWFFPTFLALTAVFSVDSLRASGPIDAPESNEPRVAVAKCLSAPGLLHSEGNFKSYYRTAKGDALFSRDILVAIPGFKVDIEPAPKTVTLTLWGNLPGLSMSPVLESSVILHDTKAFDLDLTLLGGRIVLTNNKSKGSVRVWLRADTGVQLVLPNPGDSIALEIYGRWPTGVPFSTKKTLEAPVRLWEVHCLKGSLEIKASKTEWYMTAPPGNAYFYGDSVSGPSPGGPTKQVKVPDWADPKAKDLPLEKTIREVVELYTGKLKAKEPEEVGAEILVLAQKDTNPDRARVMRTLIIHAMAALDNVERVVEFLSTSKYPEVRNAAVVALRHWIGSRPGRDMKLYENLQDLLNYTKPEAETIMQLLHSPFNPRQPETYETLIAYLGHRRQAIRELAAWHLVRLAPVGKKIAYDASAAQEKRDAAIAAWQKLIPSGELPKDPDETKEKKN